ncbi:hypothetical protein CEXT_527271 [Caerostris extrusa]|uniref:Uncharacterized protein n=1 Tax=Caerostris extrusa TaxID=172846 RepID=A0AAV4N1Q5_CAEEX|nr:hypothetical protein CEXT_527271 [Caerostris extrusa]
MSQNPLRRGGGGGGFTPSGPLASLTSPNPKKFNLGANCRFQWSRKSINSWKTSLSSIFGGGIHIAGLLLRNAAVESSCYPMFKLDSAD